MIIKRVKKTNIYDVFLGIGWENHSRFSYPSMRHISGNKLPRNIIAKIFHNIKGD